jgi:hypothetical protein
MKPKYEKPHLYRLDEKVDIAAGQGCLPGSGAAKKCDFGNAASQGCKDGNVAGGKCKAGIGGG